MSARPPVTAVYPGTFDPITLGYMDLMDRGARLFDRLVVAVAVGHHKRTMFTLDERLEMVREVAAGHPNVEVEPFDGLLTHFLARIGGQVVLRGVRTTSDCDYEFQMAGMNRRLMPSMDTVFLTPGATLQHISATFVREIATLGGDVSGLVAPSVFQRVMARVGRTASA